MADSGSILVTGAAGQLGAVGRTVTGLLLDRGLRVRAMVSREDDRAAALRDTGAEVVVGDLRKPADASRVVSGCRRVYFGMFVSAGSLEATVSMAAKGRERAAREPGRIEVCQGSGKESRRCVLEWRPHAGGPGRRLWGAESARGVHRHRRRSVNELDRGHHCAAWQEPAPFTTEIRAAFRSPR
jgi:hypothetical protein